MLAAEPPAWEAEELAELLSELNPSVFLSENQARILVDFLKIACTDESLRVAAADPVLKRLVQALAAERRLAPHERIKEVLTEIDCSGVVPLPPAASERYVLCALAEGEAAPVCLPRDWLRERSGLTLDADEARTLLAALQPLLSNDHQADAAAAAALAIVSRIARMQEALADPTLSSLKVVRAPDGNGAQQLSLSELASAALERRLFRDRPQARKRLGALAAALPEARAFILPDAVSKALEETDAARPSHFPTVDLDSSAACTLVHATTAFGPPDARAALLGEIFTQDAAERGALRALAAGDRRALDNGVRLVALRETAPALDRFLSVLIAASMDELLVPGAIVDGLDRTKRRHLQITELEGEELGAMLGRHAADFPLHGLDRAVAEAILCADIPEKVLRKLPILPTIWGRWSRADDLYRPNSNWVCSASLAAHVPMLAELASPIARERAEALVQSWSPDAQITFCLRQPEPWHFSADILEALTRADRPDLDLLRRVPWLVDRRDCAWKPEDTLDLPDEILTAARQALGDDLPFLPVSDISPTLRDHQGFAALRDRGVLSDGAGSLDGLLLIVEAKKLVAYMGEVNEELARALTDLAATGAVLPLTGWPLLAGVLRALAKHDQWNAGRACEVLTQFVTADSVSSLDIDGWLNALSRMAQDGQSTARAAKSAARIAYEASFKVMTGWPISSFRAVIGKVMVPTAAGTWKLGCEVTVRCTGVAPDVLLHTKLAELLPVNEEPAAAEDGAAYEFSNIEQPVWSEHDCSQSLAAVLTRLRAQVPEQALALLAALVADSDLFERLARDHLALPQARIVAIQNRLSEIVGNLTPSQTGSTHDLSSIRKDC